MSTYTHHTSHHHLPPSPSPSPSHRRSSSYTSHSPHHSHAQLIPVSPPRHHSHHGALIPVPVQPAHHSSPRHSSDYSHSHSPHHRAADNDQWDGVTRYGSERAPYNERRDLELEHRPSFGDTLLLVWETLWGALTGRRK